MLRILGAAYLVFLGLTDWIAIDRGPDAGRPEPGTTERADRWVGPAPPEASPRALQALRGGNLLFGLGHLRRLSLLELPFDLVTDHWGGASYGLRQQALSAWLAQWLLRTGITLGFGALAAGCLFGLLPACSGSRRPDGCGSPAPAGCGAPGGSATG